MTTKIRAAQYVRMSTDHQEFSTANQVDVIRAFAERHDMEVVRTFEDAGRSGLTTEGRDAITQLLEMVRSGKADFDTILVNDVTRWGRFQDVDEAAHLEYVCKRKGVTVQYCAEQFMNDGSMSSNLMKTLKRVMAGEYSRELSAKVFKGQCRLIETGFRQGGAAGHGLRRMLVNQAGEPKGVLAAGEHKSLQTDRVVLVPGPAAEIATVHRIYQLFIHERRREAEIAGILNSNGEARWSRATVHQVLTNEKYIGRNVYNRVSFKLKKERVQNPPEAWVRKNDAFEPIVDEDDFFTARGIILGRHQKCSDDEMLSRLRTLLERHGRLSAVLIDEAEPGPTSGVYRHRFGSLIQAYQAISYTPDRDVRFLEVNRQLRRLYPKIMDEVVAALAHVGGRVQRDAATDLLTINELVTASVVLARSVRTSSGSLRWTIRFDQGLSPDLTVAARMDASNEAPLDFFIFSALDVDAGEMRLGEHNGIFVDAFRFDTLDFFYGIARLVRIEEAA